MNEDGYFIYGLIDPFTKILHYVGFTTNLNYRLQMHWSNVKGTKEKKIWINKLRKQKIKPLFEIFEEVKTIEELPIAEEFWFNYFKLIGAELYNDPNYIGLRSRKNTTHTAETRLKISIANKGKIRIRKKGYHLSDNHKKNISFATKGKNKGKVVLQSTKDKLSKINTGKRASEETKLKMSQSMIGKNKGEENAMFGKKALNSKFTLQQEINIRNEYAEGNISMLKLAKKYNVSKRLIFNIIHQLHRLKKCQ